jgi:hypothetical protein
VPFVGDRIEDSIIAKRVFDGVKPTVAWANELFGLDLCGGRLARVLPEVCEEDTQPEVETSLAAPASDVSASRFASR